MSDQFLEAVKSRRSYYQLAHESPIPDSKIREIAEHAILHVPSSFNSQSARLVVILGDEHTKLWEEIVKPAVKAVAPAEAWEGSEKRLNGFRDGYGTILFYEDPADVARLQEQFPLYSDKFPFWSEHTSAMHQYVRK
jgi:predicted oxidoreductase (fatty acid repression mutant protein)